MSSGETINATEFKARCLEFLDRLANHSLRRLEVTKRGRVVAVLTPPELTETDVERLHGYQEGSVVVRGDFDWTAPVLDEPWIEVDEDETPRG